MAQVTFKKGLLKTLPIGNAVDGALYITTDEGGLYLGNADKSLTRLGDYIVKNSIDDLNTWKDAVGESKLSEHALYYIKDVNVLARWDATNKRWIQINAAGLTKVKGSGTGNVVAGMSVTTDAETGAMVLSYTTASVATAEGLEELNDTISTLSAKVGNLETLTGNHTTQITNLGTRITNELNALEEELRGGYTGDMQDLADAASNAQSAADDAADAAATNASNLTKEIADRKAADTTLQNNINTVSTNLANEVTRATEAESALGGRIDGVVADVSDLSDALAAEVTRSTNKDNDLQDGIDAANTNIGKNADAIAAEVTNRTNADTALDNKITGLRTDLGELEGTVSGHTTTLAGHTAAINTLNGDKTTEGSVAYQIAQVVAGADASFDTLKEIADWIAKHPETVSALNTAISNNAEAIGENAEAISDLQAADEALDGRIDTLEAAVGSGGGIDDRIEAELAAILGCGTDELTTKAGANYNTYLKLVQLLKNAESDIDSLQGDVSDIDGEITTMKTNISDNATAISTETTNRTKADSALDQKITAEKNRAEGIENGLRTDLTSLSGTVGENSDAISKETTDRKAADQTLQTNINTVSTNLSNEVTRAKAAEKTLTDNLATANGAISTNATAIGENAAEIDNLWKALEWDSF